MKLSTYTCASVIAAMLLIGNVALAQERHGRKGAHAQVRGHSPYWRFDPRHRHDHYYPKPGHSFSSLPGSSISVGFRGSKLFFSGGVWFRSAGTRFVVVTPPVGVVVPLLPPSYVTLWIGDMPYYYANGVYYSAATKVSYTVVEPPPSADAAQVLIPAPVTKPAPDPIIYPRNGQSAAQTEADRQDCNRWATTQPGAMADASIFQRAVAACMDGRGYTLR